MAEQKPKSKPTCYTCHEEIVFDKNKTSPTGKQIPLNPETKEPHQCKQETADQSETETQTEISKKNEEKIKQQNGQSPAVTEIKSEYVDHTLAKPSEVKIFSNTDTEILSSAYKRFQIGKKFAWSRAQYQPVTTADGTTEHNIAFYYEIAK